ncbi:MAG TPA: beta-xylosidase [Clostridiales bacterium]|nr:beta-xylosidase [Clostridiales bacterium]
MINFTIDTNDKTEFPHYWENCVGSCHAYTALREDYRKQLKKAHEELGFRSVRFHGLFNDNMSVCSQQSSSDPSSVDNLAYNFANIDNIFDFLLSIGMKPFVEIGDMPGCLASGDETFFNYKMNITPPTDYGKWNDFIYTFIEHLGDRYGRQEITSWLFEVWNEPNMAIFWTGTKDQYFELYKNTVKAIKAYDSQLKVGGPATSCNAWIPDLIQFCKENKLPLDFITTHHYPSDEQLWEKGEFDFSDVMAIVLSGEKSKFGRDIMKKMAFKAHEQAGNYPLYYTEWNPSSMIIDDIHDECYSASMTAKILSDNDGLVDGYSFWTFSDIFEECGQKAGVFYGGLCGHWDCIETGEEAEKNTLSSKSWLNAYEKYKNKGVPSLSKY